MKHLLRDLALILALASLWSVGGYAIGLAIQAMGVAYPPLKIIFASLNVIIGLVLFLGITRDPTANRIFFEGPRLNESGLPAIGCLWLAPISLLIFGLASWLVTIFMRFIFP